MKRKAKTDIVFVQFAKEKTICQDFFPKTQAMQMLQSEVNGTISFTVETPNGYGQDC